MYLLKFEDIFKSVIWGGDKIARFKNVQTSQEQIGESWEISAVNGSVSVVKEGTDKGMSLTDLIARDKENLLGKHVMERFGEKFPLLIKFIDARDNLSIQVHPNDEMAKIRHNSFGKTEMWYVIEAEPGAGLYSGFTHQITPEEYVARVENNTIMDVLQFHAVKSGDVFFLPAGCVHAIGKGLLIAEIQQSSDITYRIYDYNRKDAQGNGRQLHTEQAKDAIDYTMCGDRMKTVYTSKTDSFVPVVECSYFTTDLLELSHCVKRDIASLDSFVIYICMAGEAVFTDANGEKTTLCQGQTLLVPASMKEITIEARQDAKILESFIPQI